METNNDEVVTAAEVPAAPAAVTHPAEVVTATESAPVQPASQSRSRRKKAFLIILVLLAAVALLATGWLLGRQHTAKSNAAKVVITNTPTQKDKIVPATPKFVDSYLPAPVTFSSRPSLFSDYSYFGYDCSGLPPAAAQDASQCPTSVHASDFTYQQIGTTAAAKPIIIADNGQPGEGEQTFVVIQTDTGKYAILGKFMPEFTTDTYTTPEIVAERISDLKKALDPSTTLDMNTDLPDLTFPSPFSLTNTNFRYDYGNAHTVGYALPQGLASIRGSFYGHINPAAVTKIGNYGVKTVYAATAQDAANYSVQEVYMTVNNDYAAPYRLDDAIVRQDGKAPQITWTDNSFNQDVYSYRAAGCGSGNGYIVAKNIDTAQLKKIGTGPAGQALYSLPTNSALFQQIYNEDYGNGSSLDDSSLQNLSAEQLQSRHVVFVAKNGLGQYVVYKNDKYFQGGGCAKPVVYLYPAKSELINVSIGANISKSAPLYPSGGWQNVVAAPNGRLTYNGQSYDSLYWEGKGQGLYPSITSGTVVPTTQAVVTIRSQLAEQGLNQKETNDFVAYWAPRLPSTPFVRLTWFGTNELNQLAPLAISPKPDTVIRVFLDFQGLTLPTNLPGQHFTLPQRTGFTVVEWGGLDRSAETLR